MILIAVISLLVVAMVAYSINSVLLFRYEISLFSKLSPSFWDPKISWLNKYKVNEYGNRVPRFFLSTTVLVWTTDAYHLLQFIHLSCVQIVIGLLLNNYIIIINNKLFNCIFIIIGLKSIFSFSFEKLFTKLLISKSKV